MPCEIRPYREPGPPAFPEWQHKLVLVHAWPELGPNGRIKVTAGLHYFRGNKLPYFSVTADIYRTHAHDIVAGGQLMREVREAFPELASVQALHLSDSNGAPMHAFENGWYFLSGYFGGFGERFHAGNTKRQHWGEDGTFNGFRESTPDECLTFAAELLRVSTAILKALAHDWHVIEGGDRLNIKVRFAQWVEDQRERWAAESQEAIALLDRLIAEREI